MKVQDIEKKLDDTKKKQSSLNSQLEEKATTLTQMKAAYENAVKSGVAESELDKLDAELFKLDRARVRIEIRLHQTGDEIERLQHERAEAHAHEEREKYQSDVQAAIGEAEGLEQLVQNLVAAAALHSERLTRMRKFCESVGVGQVPFRLVNLERRVTAIFAGGHSGNQAYKQSYPEILQSNIASVERQLNHAAPVSATITTDAEMTAEQAT